ncbi:MAG TPA: M23 family metallopeptidase [Propionibacteriaceae bacterium]|nr:M23 family metallopeptidase [Propionibacteriaceae bacterium]
MRELSGEQRTERKDYPDVSAGPELRQGRGWAWHGLAALAISAVGLAVASVIGLTTNAQPTEEELTAVPERSSTVDLGPVEPSVRNEPPKHPALAAFARRDSAATNGTTRSAAVRLAIVAEQAAQRDELLAKTADKISRAAEAASSDARQRELRDADRASRERAAQIAAENLRRAIAARVAAANKRQAAESQPSNSQSQSSTQSRGSGDGGGSGSGSDPSASGSGSGGGSNGGSGGGSASPVPGAVIGAGFGEYGSWSRYHTGIDFRAAYGTPIRAVKSGVVLYAGNSGDWAGNHVAIKHADGKTTMYSHMSSMAVRAGQTVQAGQIIGRVGETGRAFGAHLHFELYPVGVKYGDVYNAINPQPWLAANGVTTH